MIDVCESCRQLGRNPHGHSTEECPRGEEPSDWVLMFRGTENEVFQRFIGPFTCQVSPRGYWHVRGTHLHGLMNGIEKTADEGKKAALAYVKKMIFQACDHLNLDRPTEKIDTTAFMF